ncbi:hypothetical protein BCR36DRAFT_156027 [Piromyces finnis]|uniref:Uncharacterized protein n=1 Tax=Piromyces finnis TaxID=1754191 RepID=A0A1Y1UX83_9FUNG|nr:hypothetical protein BCR36DRAFT_156027 [Piromyces finnis]|eukprot:ORX42693.1 hypothetical protein BCR36DRAFT_156027 [Piromyces finnis]
MSIMYPKESKNKIQKSPKEEFKRVQESSREFKRVQESSVSLKKIYNKLIKVKGICYNRCFYCNVYLYKNLLIYELIKFI